MADEVRVRFASSASQPSAARATAEQLVWSETLHMPDASFITPHFSHFDLPPSAKLIVRSPDHSRSWTFTGYGKGNRYLEDGFWGVHIWGDTAILELWSKTKLDAGAVVIDAYTHGYPDARWPEPSKAGDPEDDFASAFGESPWWQSGAQKAICGADDSENARCYQSSESTLYNESRAVARLLINGSGACTGWLIGDQGHLMTNEHCITTPSDAANTNYEFNAEGATCGTNCSSGGACPGTVVATSATFIQDDATLDYALVRLPTNPTGTYGFMQLRSSGAAVNERIYIPQHPSFWGKRIGVFSGDSSDQSGFCEVTSLNSPPCSGGSGRDVGYFCDTRGGSSGSPVLGYSDHLVVALHHCANCPNRGVPIQAIISDLGSNLPPNAIGSGGGGGGGGGGGTCNGTNCIDWDSTATVSFANQDSSSSVSVTDGGDTLVLSNNTWRRTTQTFDVTPNTVVEFDFSSTSQGEIHGIGLDEDNVLSSDRIFKVHGTQTYGFTDFDNYAGGTRSYSIPVGQFFTGNDMFLVLVNDNDAGSGNNSFFTNVRVFESGGGGGGGGGTCVVDEDFETGSAAGWANDAGSTCTTGAFILGDPSQQSSSGVTTQPAGSASGSRSVYSASNTSAGNADVDGGNCILTSPTWSVASGSTLSFNYFHGQRDGGDDANDFFNVQYRVNGGGWVNVVSNGDSQSTAGWTGATASVPAGNVQLRLQCSDGSGPGDIIECGLDDVSICN
ncbi:MAG: trypsin-like peptidase domain-containing protein [Acidobacteriota bacterium]